VHAERMMNSGSIYHSSLTDSVKYCDSIGSWTNIVKTLAKQYNPLKCSAEHILTAQVIKLIFYLPAINAMDMPFGQGKVMA
jgi:hypothetical protein